MIRHRLPALALAAAAAALVAACANPGPTRQPLPLIAPDAAGLEVSTTTPTVDALWWRSLGDPALDALVERALAGQPGLQLVAARLSRADAAVQGAAAAAEPQLGLGADATRQRYSANGLYPPPIAGSQRNSATLQASGSIELDFFGRHASALAAALGQQKAAQAELAAARVLLASRVAQAYVGLSRLFGQREVAERAQAQREAMLALTRQRVAAGFDTQVELKQAEEVITPWPPPPLHLLVLPFPYPIKVQTF